MFFEIFFETKFINSTKPILNEYKSRLPRGLTLEILNISSLTEEALYVKSE